MESCVNISFSMLELLQMYMGYDIQKCLSTIAQVYCRVLGIAKVVDNHTNALVVLRNPWYVSHTKTLSDLNLLVLVPFFKCDLHAN